jgi:hypothetical protein
MDTGNGDDGTGLGEDGGDSDPEAAGLIARKKIVADKIRETHLCAIHRFRPWATGSEV